MPSLRRTCTVLLAAIVGAGLAAPAHAVRASGWDHPGFDGEDSYYNPAESAINASTIGGIARRWVVPLRQAKDGSCARTGPVVVAGGKVIAADEPGISAFDAVSGRPQWSFTWNDPGDSGTPMLAVSADVVVAANSRCQSTSDPDGMITGLDLKTGRVKWRVASDMPADSAVVDKGIVVISGESPSDELATVAYRASDGRQLWRRAGYLSAGVSAAGRVLAVRGTTTSALNVVDGTIVWTKPQAWTAQSACPAGDRFLVTTGTYLAAVNAATGAVAWTAPGKASTLIATDGRRVYRASGRTIEALNTGNGWRTWIRQLPAEAGQPVRAGGLVYTGGPILNAASGAVLSTGAAVRGQQVVTGGRLITVRDNTLSSFAP